MFGTKVVLHKVVDVQYKFVFNHARGFGEVPVPDNAFEYSQVQ